MTGTTPSSTDWRSTWRSDTPVASERWRSAAGPASLALLAKRTRPTLAVVGLDPDPKALARANRKARREGFPLELDHGFADELPYADGSFDRIPSMMSEAGFSDATETGHLDKHIGRLSYYRAVRAS